MRADPVLNLLDRCPVYSPTTVREMSGLSSKLGGGQVWLKDESQRMELGSFKALGGAFAVAKLLENVERPEDVTFVCASAGNHGLSVAAGARVFGAKAKIVIANTVSEAFARRLEAQGAEVLRAGENYEASMLAAEAEAQAPGCQLLADSSWEGYTEVPSLVMQGYTVIGHELMQQCQVLECWPTHLFLQAGVGGLAGALTQQVRDSWPSQPEILVVEPVAAACLGLSVQRGELCQSPGPVSVMGRLDCKVPSLLALEILKEKASRFVSVSDEEAERATQLLEQEGVLTTPSGAAGLAGAIALKDELGPDSKVMLLVTEGRP